MLYEGVEIKYPKTLTKQDMYDWIEKSRLPLKLLVQQVDDDTIIMTRLKYIEVKQ